MLAFFSLGIPAMTAWQIATRAFYALQDTITPLKVGFLQIGIDIPLLLTLPKLIGYKGLPLATAISMIIGFVALINILHKELVGLNGMDILVSFAKVVIMCIVQGLVLYGAKLILWKEGHFTLAKELISTFAVGSGSMVLYFIVGFLIKYPDIDIISPKINNLLKRKREIG
jgi:putative peptidoglycan lipid II flippase